MKKYQFYIISIVLAIVISACSGAEATPTVDPLNIQSTAVAAAFTIVAETQAAIPTVTPIPPTETPTSPPIPTETPLLLPTLEASPTAISTSSSSGGDPCANRVLGSPKGKPTKIRITNETKVPITVSIYLNETASAGECGWRTYNIGRNNDVTISDSVQGCYNLWAWSDDPKGKFNSRGYGCINNPDKWTFEVREGSIKFVGP